MALQIWLPLNKNGDLSNKGLADVTVTNKGATYNSSGKIGGCYKVNGNQLSIPSASYMEMKSGKQFSFACWAKGATSSGWFIACSGWEIQFLTGYINVYPGGSSSGRDSNFSGATAVDLWRHIAFTWDGSNLILYVDGNAQNTSTFNVSYNISSKINFCYQGKRYLNDVRIYDHCLSPKEVKEISKGLVLHYPLNDPYIEGTTNLLSQANSYPNGYIISSSTSSNAYLNAGVISSNTGNEIVTYSAYVTNNSDTTIYPRLRGLKSSSTYGSYVSGNAIPAGKSGWAAVTLTYITDSSTYNGTNALLRWQFGKARNTINGNFIIQYAQLERKSHRTAWTLGGTTRIPTIVYDSSGYNNNGTITGTLTTSTDTPRYDKCTYISDGRTNYIYSDIIAPKDLCTMCLWIKGNSAGYSNYHIPYSISSSNYEFSLEGNTGLFRQGFVINGTRYCTTTSTPTIDNAWHHLAATFDGNVIKRYVDGVKISEESHSGTLSGGNLRLYIGRYGGTTYGNNLLYTSDVRLYSTALSEQDIKDLYQEAAFIDHKGNIGCYLFYEDADSQITKTGQALSEEFEEISDLSDGVAKVYELKIECNQLIEI